ncbi:MAG: CBS domain-containing protein [Hyphomicrobiales bacterium]|nr:CBS domain-containing protein [Hyphomicrobiales bacterium]
MELLDPSTPLISLAAAAIDSETTGVDPAHARIVQLASIQVDGVAIHRERSVQHLINPGVPIPEKSSTIHNIRDADVADAHTFVKIWDIFDAFTGPRVLIGYRTGFDISVLKRECALADIGWRDRYWICVQALARLLASQQLATESLESLADRFDIAITDRHTALGDAQAAAEIWVAMIPLLRRKGIRTLGEALSASQAMLNDGSQELARESAGVDADVSELKPADYPLRIDSYAYKKRLSDVMSAPPVFASADLTLQDAARLLIEKQVSSVLVRSGDAVGIVTERDVLRSIAADVQGDDYIRLRSIMNSPLHAMREDRHLYTAMARMNRLGIRHLAVSDDHGEIVGMVTPRNLLRARASEALLLGDEIEAAEDGGGLAAARAKLSKLAGGLLADELDARSICAVISAELCTLTRRASEIAEARMLADGQGSAPVPYAVMVLGSGGRGESLLAPDQDNAIVYEQGEPGGPEDLWFEQLGGHIADLLDEAGVPYCQGGVMARNAAWRKSVDGWQETIDGWVRKSSPQDLLNVDIFFDAAAVYGHPALADKIWRHAYERAHKAPAFQALLTELARRWNSPLGMWGFRTDAHDRTDLKAGGLMPIFTAARIMSIRHSLPARSTVERLRRAGQADFMSDAAVERTLSSHETILRAILKQQLADVNAGVPLSNRVAVKTLSADERSALRTAIRDIDLIVDIVSEARF